MSDDELWYKDAVFYELYVRAFKDSNGDGWGDLKGITQKLNHLEHLGVDAIWLLPISPSPLRDDGYDVSDYCEIHPKYGTLDDFRALIEASHQRSLKVLVELVPNHTSDQHPWFQASHDPHHPEHKKYKNYYVWSKTDQRYGEARIIFLDKETSNWTYDPLREAYFWHRFFSHQPDLNYDNPQVQRAMLRVIQFWIDQGVDGIRVDAPPYLFEREGTNCENLSETHAFLKRLRAFVDAYAPGTMLLSEANQWPEDVIHYFGDGDEMHMNFHFPLMPRLFMALAKADRSPIVEVLVRTPKLPENCQWGTFLRCHDELTLEMVTPAEREWMWDFYAPEPRMRLNLGIRRRLAPLLGNDVHKIMLMNSLLFTLGGSPFIYYGDEIGMGDNIWLDDRSGVRTPMQWDNSQNSGFSEGPADMLYSPLITDEQFRYKTVNVASQMDDEGSLFNQIRHMIAVRKQHRAFGRGSFSWIDGMDGCLAVYQRGLADKHFLVINNLSDHSLETVIPGHAHTYQNILDGIIYQSATLRLDPYQYLWLLQKD